MKFHRSGPILSRAALLKIAVLTTAFGCAATMFAWAPVPEPFKELGSVEFAKLLIEKADLAVSPGIGFGEHGDDYVRIALVENEQRIRQAARNVRRFLETADKTLHNVVAIKAARR